MCNGVSESSPVVADYSFGANQHMNESSSYQRFRFTHVLRIVGCLKVQVSFAKEPYKRDDILQKGPMMYTCMNDIYVQVRQQAAKLPPIRSRGALERLADAALSLAYVERERGRERAHSNSCSHILIYVHIFYSMCTHILFHVHTF